MDKIKKVFSPGSKKDDEVLYGDAAERRRESASKAPETQEPEQLRPVEGLQKKEHSILRQITNPGGDKFDDQRFGTTATSEPNDPNKLQTHPEAAKKEHTILDQVINPGADKYDPQRFESTASTEGDRRNSVRPEAPAIVGADTKLETDPEEKKHEHSILRQIINPGGAKYDEEGYGTTAHAAGSLGNAPSETKDHSVARQILNPGHEKYDPVVHGSSGEPGPSSVGATSSMGLQQPTQPTAGAAATGTIADKHADPITGGSITTTAGQGTISGSQGTDVSRDAAIVGGGAAAAGVSAAAYSNDKPKQDLSSTTSTTTTTTSSHPQPLADRSAAGTSHINPVAAPEPTASQAGESHLGRDAAITGGAGLAGGAAYSQLNKPKDDMAAATYTEHSQPLASSSQTSSSEADQAVSSGPTASTGTQQVGGAHVNPIGAPEASLEGQPRLGQDAALAGGVGVAGIAAESGVTQLNKAPKDVQQATYTERAYPIGRSGPHQTETANKLDPHLPGEFPTETGEDKHGQNPTTLGGMTTSAGSEAAASGAIENKEEKQTLGSRISAGVAGIASAVGLSSNKKTDEPMVSDSATTTKGETLSSAEPTTTAEPKEHHYGRDAAAVGGLGAAGTGAYAATRDTESSPKTQGAATQVTQPTTSTTSTATSGERTQSAEIPFGGAHPSQPMTADEKASESHTGRDAALAGGAGVAGIGAYAASKDTGPASKTVGPHESKIANIVEPTVKMEPEKMKESKTSGPHSSDIANKMDPRVKADTATNEKEETHYGRDAAVAGGAGVAGAGAYAAMKEEKPTTQTQTDSNDPAVIAARRAAEKESQPSASDDKHAKHDKSHGEEGGEKKRGLLDKILHPGRKSEDKDHGSSAARTSVDSDGHNKLHKKALGDAPHHETATFAGNEAGAGAVIEPHTGLPMNVEKYGSTGAGGTDGAKQIEGYQAGEEGVSGPDWDAIKKANTPY